MVYAYLSINATRTISIHVVITTCVAICYFDASFTDNNLLLTIILLRI